LDVEVVVGHRLPAEIFLNVKCHVVQLALPFERRAERASDVLAQPAAKNLLPILFAIERHVSRTITMYDRTRRATSTGGARRI
jgi:hypothetical protein